MHFSFRFIIFCIFSKRAIMNLSEEVEMSCRILGTTYSVITEFPSEKLLINHIFAIALNSLLIIPTILLNAVAIITILKYSQLNNKPCYFIILVQSIIDLAVGVLGIPLILSNCIVENLVLKSSFLPYGLSIVTLSALTMERYIAILHPYAYSTHVTKKRLLIYMITGAVVMFSVIIFSFLNPRLLQIFGTVVETLLFFFTAFAYTRIYLVVRKLARSPNQRCGVAVEENLTRMKLFLREIKQAKSCFMIVICFFVLCLFPGAMAFPFSDSFDKHDRLAISIWIVTLKLSNSSANSLIFFWTKTMLRKEAVKMLKIMGLDYILNI